MILWATRVLAALILAISSAAVLAQDTRIVFQVEQDAFSIGGQQQEAQDEELVIWLRDDAVRHNQGDSTFIGLFDENKMYIVEHSTNSYIEVDLPIDILSMVPEEARPMMEQVLGQMDMETEITATDEEGTINGWEARKYIVHVSGFMGMEMEHTLWMSTDPGVDASRYNQMISEMAALQPGQGEWMAELQAIEGFPVLTETVTRVMGTEFASRQRLISVEEAEAPEGAFEPPQGYSRDDFDLMDQLGGQ